MGIACVSTATATTSCTGHRSLCSSSSTSLWLVPQLTHLPCSLSRSTRLRRPSITCQRHELHKSDIPEQWRGPMIPLRRGQASNGSNNSKPFQKRVFHSTTSTNIQPHLNFEQPPSRAYNYDWKLIRQQNEYGSELEHPSSLGPVPLKPDKGWLRERDRIKQLTAAHSICNNFANRKGSVEPVLVSETKFGDDPQVVGFQTRAQVEQSILTEEYPVSSRVSSPQNKPNGSNDSQPSQKRVFYSTAPTNIQPHVNFEQLPSRAYNYDLKLIRQQNEYGLELENPSSFGPVPLKPKKGSLRERDRINQLTAAHSICNNFANRKGSIRPVLVSETKFDDDPHIMELQTRAQVGTSILTEEYPVSSRVSSPPNEPLIHKDDFVGYNLQNQEVQEMLEEPPVDEMTLINGEKSEINLNGTHTITMNEQTKSLLRVYDNVLVVDTVSKARQVAHLLTTKYKDLVHACDTEVANIDVKQETPVGHGEMICFSIYSGPTADFGNGKSCIWVDTLDGESNILAEFFPFFEDASIKKVWHNYSFDCHILQNYNIKLFGFHADTIHLARLWDSSRRMDGGYSLEALTSDPRVGVSNKGNPTVGKISMKNIFGKKKLKKDGTEGKIVTIAPVDVLQREERIPWICYSALDSISTLNLFECLKLKLMDLHWEIDGQTKGTMYDFYEEYWRPFGNLLTELEAAGMLVDRSYLSEIEKVAVAEQQVAADKFRDWASKYCADAKYMNVGSDTQIRQLLFGGATNIKNQNECLPTSRTIKVPNVDNVIEEGKKSPSKFRNITLHKIGDTMQTEIYTASGWPSVGADALKTFAGKVSTEYLPSDDYEIEDSVDDTESEILSEKSSNKLPGLYGSAYVAFGKGREGKEACHAIAALCEICSIDSLISNFILPLQGDCISGKGGRIHCSLNINTETGRLSARRPNLQNPPALEKDRYKIRQAFVASPGNSLIVADYGQLELRILAHLAGCKSMMDAFKAGGDFHSRTALNMYSYIREAVDKKEVLLEWYPKSSEDKPPAPLLKDKFASERRKAKMLNFSIAYGKTPVGLSRDWKVSVKEARETVKLWYKERQEVRKWQEARKEEALKYQRVKTLLGRSRKFPSTKDLSNAQKGHIERAAINTPVQGSAADVAMCAMLQIVRNERLKELGWKLLLQVHDEVILEGPSESAEEAKALVVECMSKPFYGRNILSVDLAVDAKCAQSWYAAK